MKNQPPFDARVQPPTDLGPAGRGRVGPRLQYWGRLLTWALLAATLAGRLGAFFFLFELFSHFAVQYAGIAALLLIFWLVTGSSHRLAGRAGFAGPRGLAAVAMLVLSINGGLVLPWLTAPESAGAGPRDLRVLHANVLFADQDYARIVRLVQAQSPDLFVLQEMTPESIRGVSALRPAFPYQYHIWSKGPCHILVGSRTPIRVDSSLARPERVISLTTTVRGHELDLLTVHPPTPLLPSWFAHRNQQLAFVASKARQQRLPTLVVGDFNISVFSPVYHQLFEQSPLTACRRGFGLQPTWPRFLTPMLIPIDHAFVNAGFRTVNCRALAQPGSDHRALVVDLAFAGAPAQP